MAVKDLKNRVRVGLTIDINLNDRFRELSEETSIPMSKLLDKAIERLLVQYQNEGRV